MLSDTLSDKINDYLNEMAYLSLLDEYGDDEIQDAVYVMAGLQCMRRALDYGIEFQCEFPEDFIGESLGQLQDDLNQKRFELDEKDYEDLLPLSMEQTIKSLIDGILKDLSWFRLNEEAYGYGIDGLQHVVSELETLQCKYWMYSTVGYSYTETFEDDIRRVAKADLQRRYDEYFEQRQRNYADKLDCEC